MLEDEEIAEAEDRLTVRLEQLRLGVTILLLVASVVVTLDQLSDSTMLDGLKARWEHWLDERKRAEEFSREAKHVIFEAYRVVSEAA